MPKSKTKFFGQFIKSGREIGSVTPSSRFLTKRILAKINFENSKNLVEYGPGTGVFTFEILKKMSSDSKLFVFELNEEMFDLLSRKINDPRCILIKDSAEKLPEILAAHNVSEVDYIVSSLPFTYFPKELTKNILQTSYEKLSNKGEFIQFMYTKLFLKKMKAVFKDVRHSYVLLNIPPAHVFVCKK
jgi:phospholipid N-methyltransferase